MTFLVSGQVNNKGTKRKTQKSCQNVTQKVLKSKVSKITNLLHRFRKFYQYYLAQKLNLEICNVQRDLSVTQTQSILALMEKCFMNLKIGRISKNIKYFVLNNNLLYVLIGYHIVIYLS